MNHSPITKWYQPLLKLLSRTFLIQKHNWPATSRKKKKVLKHHNSSQKMGLFTSVIATYHLPAKESP